MSRCQKRTKALDHCVNTASKEYVKGSKEENRAILRAIVYATGQEKAAILEAKWLEWCSSIDANTTLVTIWIQIKSIRGRSVPRPPIHDQPRRGRMSCLNFCCQGKSDTPSPIQQSLEDHLPQRLWAIADAGDTLAGSNHPNMAEKLGNTRKISTNTVL